MEARDLKIPTYVDTIEGFRALFDSIGEGTPGNLV